MLPCTAQVAGRRGRNLQLQFGIMSRSSAGPSESEFQYHLFPSLPSFSSPLHRPTRRTPFRFHRGGDRGGPEEADGAAELVICAVSTATVISWYDSSESSSQTEGNGSAKSEYCLPARLPYFPSEMCLPEKWNRARIADFLAAAPLFSSPPSFSPIMVISVAALQRS